ncbi:MAG TPA: TIGR02391 family protein [Patescibacteria group bacterium]
MANLNTLEKQILEKLFQMYGGGVLNFTHQTMWEFFRDDLSIDIHEEKYNYNTGSKANLMRGFWLEDDDTNVGIGIIKVIEYLEGQILLGNLKKEEFPNDLVVAGKQVANRLLGAKKDTRIYVAHATYDNGNINIELQKEIFDHVQKLLNDGHYFSAVEESYKIVRKKLKDVTGKEKAHEAFNCANYSKIFGHEARNEAENNFFEGVKFLHLAIQNLRNEKAHTPANDLDKNLAIHYISLASLAYDLINRK